ncbi:MAG: DEAD/DEAH box helicase [Rhodospirillales bacterium]|nr:DEAD/DEAH box helicase [Rhodospirillales bacterium]
MSFADLGLSDEVLHAVADAGYTEPTPIQKQAIPLVLMGRDILGCAQTGTGKTAGFTLPMIDILASGQAKARMPRSLILEPTRELAAQVAQSFETYGKYHKLTKALLIGGHTMGEQVKVIERGVDVLIATPGRLLDLFGRGHLLMHDVKILVIDESDRMLDMGFIPDVEKIVGLLPKMRTTLFFSATMPPEIRRLADKFLINPKEIHVSPPATAAETVVQGMVMVTHKDGRKPGGGQKEKRAALRDLIRRENVKNALIFCNRKRDVDVVFRSLLRHGFDAARLHGDMAQPVRTETLDKFRSGAIRLLVCSDVAARGLDIPAMSHVFNFDVPTHAEDYIHRIGRTGRAGLVGRAFTVATPQDGKYIDAIERLTGKKIPGIALKGAVPAAPVAGAPQAAAPSTPTSAATPSAAAAPTTTGPALQPSAHPSPQQPGAQGAPGAPEKHRRRRRRGGRGRRRGQGQLGAQPGGQPQHGQQPRQQHGEQQPGQRQGQQPGQQHGPQPGQQPQRHDQPRHGHGQQQPQQLPQHRDHGHGQSHGHGQGHGHGQSHGHDHRRDHRHDQGRGGGNEPKVKGLGDHMPAFLRTKPPIDSGKKD